MSRCSLQVGRMGDLVAMSEAGAAGAFLNPHGFVHDMVTLGGTVNVMPHGRPETLNSWFPGYAWTLAYCRSCSLHLVSNLGSARTSVGVSGRMNW